MDVFYSKWTRRKQARMDVATAIFLFAYLALLLYGCCTSAWYSIIFHQHNNSAWAPALAPIKIIMGCGIVLTILQSVSEFFKAYAFAKGETIGEEIPERILLERECKVEVEEKKTESDRKSGLEFPLPESAHANA